MSHLEQVFKGLEQTARDLDKRNSEFPATREFLQKKSEETGREITLTSHLTPKERDELFQHLRNKLN